MFTEFKQKLILQRQILICGFVLNAAESLFCVMVNTVSFWDAVIIPGVSLLTIWNEKIRDFEYAEQKRIKQNLQHNL